MIIIFAATGNSKKCWLCDDGEADSPDGWSGKAFSWARGAVSAHFLSLRK